MGDNRCRPRSICAARLPVQAAPFVRLGCSARRHPVRAGNDRSAAERVSTHIADLEERAATYSGPDHHYVVDEHIDAMLRPSHSDAAESLSAIRMIVPWPKASSSNRFSLRVRCAPPSRWSPQITEAHDAPVRTPSAGTANGISDAMKPAATSSAAPSAFGGGPLSIHL